MLTLVSGRLTGGHISHSDHIYIFQLIRQIWPQILRTAGEKMEKLAKYIDMYFLVKFFVRGYFARAGIRFSTGVPDFVAHGCLSTQGFPKASRGCPKLQRGSKPVMSFKKPIFLIL